MNEKRLEEWLHKGKTESEAFFSHSDLNALKQKILQSAANEHSSESSIVLLPKRKVRRSFWYRAGAAAAGMLLCATLLLTVVNRQPDCPDNPVSGMTQQPIQLDDSGKDYQVSFFPVEIPQSEPSIMSVLWTTDLDGQSEMLYTSLFESCNELYPVSTIALPGASSRFVLLTSGDSARGFIHYRLIGYAAGTMTTLWSQDYVPDGKLGVQDNMLIEQRSSDKMQTQVSYILPYHVVDTATVSLPVEHLQLHVGDLVIFVGDSEEPLFDISAQTGMMRRVENGSDLYGEERGVAFVASGSGSDLLSLSKEKSPEAGHLTLDILQ